MESPDLAREYNFRLGDRIAGYSIEGTPIIGRICRFEPDLSEKHEEPIADVRVQFTRKEKPRYFPVRLNTCHLVPRQRIRVEERTFYAAASRVGPSEHFKSSKDQRDFLVKLWAELERCNGI